MRSHTVVVVVVVAVFVCFLFFCCVCLFVCLFFLNTNNFFLGAPSILVTNFLVKSPTKSPISNHQFFLFQVTKNVLYNSVTINISNPQSQLNHTAHFDDLKQKNWWFEIGDLVGDFTKKLVTRMDGAPYIQANPYLFTYSKCCS